MQNYIQVSVVAETEDQKEAYSAFLFELGAEGTEEHADGVFGYFPESDYVANAVSQSLMELCSEWKTQFSTTVIPPTNWNAEWESNYPPVILEGYCTIAADFHTQLPEVPFPIRIHPKMSFGTGHHSTTEQMLRMMQHIDFTGKSVFDFGCGTGILGILAAKKGAARVVGNEIEDWSVENARDNAAINAVQMDVRLGGMEVIPETDFDYCLANINKHVLLEFMPQISGCVRSQATLWMSGIYVHDIADIREKAEQFGLEYVHNTELNEWACIEFRKL